MLSLSGENLPWISVARERTDVAGILLNGISHLAGLVGTSVKVTLEIEAKIPNGASEDVVRIVTENARTLKFDTQGFESE